MTSYRSVKELQQKRQDSPPSPLSPSPSAKEVRDAGFGRPAANNAADPPNKHASSTSELAMKMSKLKALSDADKDLICRVAGSEQLEVASIARETISGLRLAAATRSLSRRSGSTAAGHATLRSMLKTFPAAYSPQNFVLVLEVPPQEALVGSSTAADGSAAVVTDPDGYVELRSLARSCGPESTATAASVCLPCV